MTATIITPIRIPGYSSVVTADIDHQATPGQWVKVDATAANRTETLPANPGLGDIVGVQKSDATAHTVTIVDPDGATVAGDPTGAQIVAQGVGARLVWNGTGWDIDAITGGTGSAPYALLAETVYAGGNSGSAKTIDLANGTVQKFTLTAVCTFTMPTAVAGRSFVVALTQDATGTWTAAFTGVLWPAGTAPTITVGNGKKDRLAFACIDGTNWEGSVIGQDVR